jgi:hypothetical protein
MPENATRHQKCSTHDVFRAGAEQVIAEIRRRGGSATLIRGRRARVHASGADGRTVVIRVKTKTRGTWQASIGDGRPTEETQSADQFWVLVDVGHDEAEFYITPAGWMQRDIGATHQEYLARHGGHRAENDESNHHAIGLDRVEQWKDRWDILGMF